MVAQANGSIVCLVHSKEDVTRLWKKNKRERERERERREREGEGERREREKEGEGREREREGKEELRGNASGHVSLPATSKKWPTTTYFLPACCHAPHTCLLLV